MLFIIPTILTLPIFGVMTFTIEVIHIKVSDLVIYRLKYKNNKLQYYISRVL